VLSRLFLSVTGIGSYQILSQVYEGILYAKYPVKCLLLFAYAHTGRHT